MKTEGEEILQQKEQTPSRTGLKILLFL